MKHPNNRAERRHNGNTWRDRQRAIMRTWWRPVAESLEEYWKDNNMWNARKQSVAHGNRCACHFEKYSSKEIRKRRRALDEEILLNLLSWGEEVDVQTNRL